MLNISVRMAIAPIIGIIISIEWRFFRETYPDFINNLDRNGRNKNNIDTIVIGELVKISSVPANIMEHRVVTNTASVNVYMLN